MDSILETEREGIERSFEDKSLPLSKLKVDHTYQRPLEAHRLMKMRKDFDPGAVRMVFVSQRKGSEFYIIDGQHTVELLKEEGVKEVYCRVFKGLSVQDEALMFEAYNQNHKRPTPIQIFNASLVGGRQEAVEIDEVLGKYHLYLGARNKATNDDVKYPIRAVKAVTDLYRTGGQILISATIDILIKGWGVNAAGLSKEMIAGMGRFLWKNAHVDEQRLVEICKLTPPSVVIDRARKNSPGSTSSAYEIATAIAEFYREGNPPMGIDKIRQNSHYNVWPLRTEKKEKKVAPALKVTPLTLD